MKFKKLCVPLLWICVLLASVVQQTRSGGVGQEAIMGSLPVLSGIVGIAVTGPMAPILYGSLGIIQLASTILNKDDSDGGALSKTDFLESQSKITDALKNVDTHVLEAAEKLTDIVESHEFLENMRNDLDTLQQAFANNMKVIANPKANGITRQKSMHAMLDYFSTFRQILRSFVSKYIKPKGVIAASGDVNLFYDFMLRKERILADRGDDCHLDSTHSKLFKSFMYILKILTDAYVMGISAHTVQYQKELKTENQNEAIETQQLSLQLLNQYKADMKAFMDKTKWALDKASREIRNCGTFELNRGETFEHIPFANTLPKLKDWNYDRNERYSFYSGPSYRCFRREKDVKFGDYEIGESDCIDNDIRRPGKVQVFLNSTNSEWPYMYFKNDPTFGADQEMGHTKSGSGLFKHEYMTTRSCYTVFCPAFKKRSVAISTQVARAKPGNVITGLRFRVSKNVIYIDIQEGKYLDDLRVDPETVTWTETPQSDEVLYLNIKARKLELGAAELNDNKYLTSIQLKLKNAADGIIGVYVGGAKAPNWTTSGLTGSSDISKSNELVLSGADNPEQIGADVKNIVSKAPIPSKPFHVSFQPSDLNKDFGITTIPLIDIREVVSNPPAPISGFGIYHQSVKGSGGFISLKLVSSNLSSFIDYNLIEKAMNMA